MGPSTSIGRARGPTRRERRAVLLTLALSACGRDGAEDAGGAGAPERPHVVLITVDTLRKDHLSCYGYERPTSPEMDRLAQDGTRFTNAVVPRPLTAPSVASLFTGLYPYRHGVASNYMQLDDSLVTLAERLGEGGYRTAGFVSNYVLVHELSNAQQGFDRYDDFLPDREQNRRLHERTAAGTLDRAVAWLREVPDDRPWFLWVHLIDPHGPYTPPVEDLERFMPATPEPIEAEVVPRYQLLDTLDRSEYVRRYDAEIAYCDRMLGRLLRELREQDLHDSALIVLHADHGESLGEFGAYFMHGQDLYEPCVAVPLLIKWPGGRGALPAVTDVLASIPDLMPTILRQAGVPVPDGLDGEDLHAVLLRGARERNVLLERFRARGGGDQVERQLGLRSAGAKLLYRLDAEGRVELREHYRVVEEQSEQNTYRTEDPGVMELEMELTELVRQVLEHRLPFEPRSWVPEDAEAFLERHNQETLEHLEALKALGYTR